MADPHLIRTWLHARSLSHGAPLPVDDHGGWRVDTGSDVERCRSAFLDDDAAPF